VGANFTINPLGVTVTATPKDKTYGSLDPTFTFSSNPTVGSLLANGDAISFTGSLTRAPGETVLGSPYAINQGSVANSNYTITYIGANFTIDPLGVTVTANTNSKTYGALDPVLTFTSNPAVGSLLANGDAISFTGSLTRAPGETVSGGPYAINQGTVANDNYSITYTGANFTINPLGVIVTAIGDNCDFVSRFFTPQASILEDPVTGSAHCSLIPFWARRLNKKELIALQISERVGKLYCEENGDRVIISGEAKTYSIGNLWTE